MEVVDVSGCWPPSGRYTKGEAARREMRGSLALDSLYWRYMKQCGGRLCQNKPILVRCRQHRILNWRKGGEEEDIQIVLARVSVQGSN